jgi:hypothetical protein
VAQPKRFRPIFNCRFDELAPLARLLRASYVRDQKDFADLLPDDYTAAFLTDYDLHLQAVEKLVNTSVQIAKGTLFTQKVQDTYDALPALLNRLEARVRRAENLTVPAKKFGIEDARQSRTHQDREALADDLKTLLQNITANSAALVKKGQKPAETAQIQALYDALVANSTAHGTSQSTQRQLTQDNTVAVRALSEPMQHLLADGKALYARSNKAKLADYTYKQLLKRVRQTQAAAEGSASVA